jgi:hypothetical protein
MIFLTLLFTFSCVNNSHAQRRNKVRKLEYNSSYNYEVATVAVGVDGTKLVKVWGYGKKVEDAIRNAKKLAVAAAIFSGFPAAPGGAAASTPPILKDKNADTKYADFFENFFAPGGKYLQFVQLSNDAPPSGKNRIKVNKKTYKVGVLVSVAYDNLRKYLEDQGIARSLDAGF